MSALWQGSKRTVSAKPSINIEASPMELDTKESDANPNSSLATAEVWSLLLLLLFLKKLFL